MSPAEQPLPQPSDPGRGVGADFFFFLTSTIWAFADCAEGGAAKAIGGSAFFGAGCADDGVAKPKTVTNAMAVVHIFLGSERSHMGTSKVTALLSARIGATVLR